MTKPVKVTIIGGILWIGLCVLNYIVFPTMWVVASVIDLLILGYLSFNPVWLNERNNTRN